MRVARGCLVILLVLLPLVGGRQSVVSLAILAALTTLGWIAWVAARPAPAPPALPLRWPLLALLAVTLLTLLTSVYRAASLLALAQTAALVGIVALAATLGRERRHLLVGAQAVAAGVLLGLLYGWKDWLVWLLVRGAPNWRVISTWDNPNSYAGFLLLCLPLLAVLAIRADRGRWLFGLTALLVLPTLVMTQSRGGLLALLLCLLAFVPAWAWAEGRLTARTLGLAGIGFAVLIGLALLSPVGKRVLDPATRARQLHSQRFRYYTWLGTLHMARAHPWLGVGPGAFASAYGQYQLAGFTRNGHSLYLQAAAETGWPGLGVLLLLFGGIALNAIQVARAPAEPEERRARRALAVGLLAGLFGLLLHGVVDSDWPYPGIQLALLLQAVLVMQWHTAPAPRPASGWVRAGVPVGMALIAILLLPAALAQRAADAARLLPRTSPEKAALLRRAVRLAPAVTANLRELSPLVPPAEGEALLRRAQRLEPTNPANWLYLGHLYLRDGRPREARQAYVAAERRQPRLLPALFGVAQAAWEARDAAGCRQALDRLLALQHSEVERLRPIEVPETWYLKAWYGLAYLARRDGDRAGEAAALHRTLEAIAAYGHGQTVDAEAWTAFTGNDLEHLEVRLLKYAAYHRLAELQSDTARYRSAAEAVRAAYFQPVPLSVLNAPPDTPFP